MKSIKIVENCIVLASMAGYSESIAVHSIERNYSFVDFEFRLQDAVTVSCTDSFTAHELCERGCRGVPAALLDILSSTSV